MPYSTRNEISISEARLQKRLRELEAENETLRRLLSRHGYPTNTEISPESLRRAAAV